MIEIILFIGLLHILGFLNAYLRQTDQFTDMIYAISFAIIAGYGLSITKPSPGLFHWILAGMVIIWALRLAAYLGYRIHIWGRDKRFDDFRKDWGRLVRFWIMQFVTIIVVILPVIFVMPDQNNEPGFLQGFGLVTFLFGLVIESVADYQKFVFKQDPENKNDFIKTGLWKYSRHPNYLGEWIVWVGIFIYCAPFLSGIEWIALISPIWMYILLRYVSGGNLLEKSASSKYAGRADYKAYLENTGVFFPKILP